MTSYGLYLLFIHTLPFQNTDDIIHLNPLVMASVFWNGRVYIYLYVVLKYRVSFNDRNKNDHIFRKLLNVERRSKMFDVSS